MNRIQLLASLDSAMEKWLENQCNSGEFWPSELVIGELTAWLMARAAFTVLEGIDDALIFGVNEELLKRI